MLLLGAARFALSRRSWEVGRERFDDLATQAADDALVAVLERLDDYRGESRFTTWAWKFAFYEACAAVRRRSWLRREVPVEAEGWEALGHEAGPDVATEQAELLAALKSAADEVLTPHQRSVFVALALNEVPVDVLAERLGTKRGALYKTLHDARGRLRRALAAAGLGPPAWQITSRVQVTWSVHSRSIASWKATTFAVDGSACGPAPAVPAARPETTRTAAAASATVLVRIRYLLHSGPRSIRGVRRARVRFLPR